MWELTINRDNWLSDSWAHMQIIFEISLVSCDDGWEDSSCSTPTTRLKTYAYSMFSEETKESLEIVGGKPALTCQVLASGTALHFTGVRLSV